MRRLRAHASMVTCQRDACSLDSHLCFPHYVCRVWLASRWSSTRDLPLDTQGLPILPHAIGRVVGKIQTIQVAGER